MGVKQNQTKLRMRRTTNVDISGYKSVEIRYITPSGTKGKFTAAVENASTGTIYYDVTEKTDISESGDWKTWAYVMFSDDRYAEGDVVIMQVKKPGER